MVSYYRRLPEYAFDLLKRYGIQLNDFAYSDTWIFNFMKRNTLPVSENTYVGPADNKTSGEKEKNPQRLTR